MSPIQSLITVLFALGSAGALAQGQAAPAQSVRAPAQGGASYGPVLDQRPPARATTERPARAGTRAIGETRPQAQEERAGEAPLTGWEAEVDPSARPAPTPAAGNVKPSTQQAPRTQQEQRGVPERQTQKQARHHPRRPGAVQRIEATPRIAAPAPAPAARVPRPAPPRQVAPQSNQALGCMGGTCTDASGAGYNAGGGGNVVLGNDGRLCTRNGANIQCL